MLASPSAGPSFLLEFGCCAFDLIAVANIHLPGQSSWPAALGRFGRPLSVQIEDAERAAFLGQTQRGRAADAAGAAGENDPLA